MLQSVSKNCLPSCSGMWTSRRLIWISILLFLCKEFWNMAIGVIGNYYYAIMAKKAAFIGKKFVDIVENDVNGTPHKLSEYCLLTLLC